MKLGLSSEAHGQHIQFNLMILDPCSGNVQQYFFSYYLEKDSVIYHSDASNTVHLPSKGTYTLYAHPYAKTQVEIDSIINVHQIEDYRIQEFVVTHDKHAYVFKDCGEKLNGDVVAKYKNGNIRFYGNFKKGHVIGYLSEFFPDGTLKHVRLFDKKGFFVEDVFVSGNQNTSN